MTRITDRNPATGRMQVAGVERLHQLVGGDPVTEDLILGYIGRRWGARNLFYLPPTVAAAVVERPVDFLRAVKEAQAPVLKL